MARKPDIIPNYDAIDDKILGEELKKLMKYITDNSARFSEALYCRERSGNSWGKAVYGRIYILASKWDMVCKEIDIINSRAFLKWLKHKGYIVVDSAGNPTTRVRVNGKVSRCVALEARKISAAAA